MLAKRIASPAKRQHAEKPQYEVQHASNEEIMKLAKQNDKDLADMFSRLAK